MKKLFTTSLLLGALTLANLASAADLTVGPGGTYATIGDAITAAASGDRILVKPKAIPYGETLNITKSLTIVSADEGTYFNCSGTWTFTPASAGQKLTVIGLRLLAGSFVNGGNAPAGTRAQIELLSSVVKGNVDLYNYSNYRVTLAADSVQGRVWLRMGRVIGNYIDGSLVNEVVRVFDDVATNDSVWIVGNRIRGNRTNGHWNMYLSSATQYMYIANNYLLLNDLALGVHYSDYGIYCDNWKGPAGGGYNTIANNTVLSQGGDSYNGRYGIRLISTTTNSYIINNVVSAVTAGNSTRAGILESSGVNNYTLAYNYLRGFTVSATVPGNGTANVNNANVKVTAATGDLDMTGGNAADNGAAPDPDYTDIDLTVGDAGAYGGSFTQANFHPFVSTTALNNRGGRVFLMRAPRTVLQGGSLQVKAEGFDR